VRCPAIRPVNPTIGNDESLVHSHGGAAISSAADTRPGIVADEPGTIKLLRRLGWSVLIAVLSGQSLLPVIAPDAGGLSAVDLGDMNPELADGRLCPATTLGVGAAWGDKSPRLTVRGAAAGEGQRPGRTP
jgi:hypothetical protein